MSSHDFLDIEATHQSNRVILHAGIISPLATDTPCCSFCGSSRDLRYTRRGTTEAVCGICGNMGEPIPKSAFEAQQIRELNL